MQFDFKIISKIYLMALWIFAIIIMSIAIHELTHIAMFGFPDSIELNVHNLILHYENSNYSPCIMFAEYVAYVVQFEFIALNLFILYFIKKSKVI